MPHRAERIKQRLFDGKALPYFIRHGANVEYRCKDVHTKTGEVHSDRYSFSESELDTLIIKTISSIEKQASARITGKHTKYDAHSSESDYSPGKVKPVQYKVGLKLTLKLINGHPDIRVEEMGGHDKPRDI